jgi:predicted  nucleic acid-binding Zn-ribbon protein
MTTDFHEQLALLRQLQDIDLNLHQGQLTLSELPGRIKDDEAEFDAVKGEFEGAKQELLDVEKQKRTDESDLEASVTHLREREAKLYAIKTNKEYQAAIKEVSEGKRINREREDRVIQAMEKIEALKQKITQLDKDFAEKKAKIEEKRKALAAEEAEVRRKMQEDAVHRPGIAAKIEKGLLRKYDFVRRRYAMAVTEVKDGACCGCSTRVTPQLLNEMLRGDDWKICPSCQRLIYIDASKDDETGGDADGGSK